MNALIITEEPVYSVILSWMQQDLSDRILAFHNADLRSPQLDADWVRRNGVIVHYCGKNKPWHENYRGVLDVFYREIATEKE